MQPPPSALSSGRSQTASGYERPPLNKDSTDKDDFQLKDDLGIEQTLYTSPENIHSPVDYTDPNNDIDPSDVTDRELAGWYGYGFAAEAYGVCAIAFLIPITLEQMAAQNGYEISDYTTPCNWQEPGYKCAVRLGDSWIDPSAFYFYTNSIGVALQAILLIGMGSLADHGSGRKTMMLAFGTLGAITTGGFSLITTPSLFWLAALLAIISNISFGTSWVFYNSFLPVLTRHHPDVKDAYENKDKQALSILSEKTSNLLSTTAFAFGYLGGILAFAIAFGTIVLMGPKLYSQQVGISTTGVWWLVFMALPLILLKSRPGLPLPAGENFFLYSYKRVYKTLKSASQLTQIMRFLGAWLLLSDAVNTIIVVAVLFAQTQLGASVKMLAGLAALVPLCAIFGACAWCLCEITLPQSLTQCLTTDGFLYIQRVFKMPTKTMILIVVFLQIMIPLYGILGLFAPFGLLHQWELWPVAIYHGLCLGAMQSFSRVLYSEMIPKSREAEFFSLYAITDKGASWIGPLVVGAITDNTHQPRYSFFFLVACLIVAWLIIMTVDPDKAKKDSEIFSKTDKK